MIKENYYDTSIRNTYHRLLPRKLLYVHQYYSAMKIPTAKEFYKNNQTAKTIEQILIEFASLHTRAALEAAAKDPAIECYYEEYDEKGERIFDNLEGRYYGSKDSGGVECAGRIYVVDGETIAAAYPLSKIK